MMAVEKIKHPTWRTKLLAHPKHLTPKFNPPRVERIVDPPGYRPHAGSEINLRIPPRVLIAALPYERVLKSTSEQFSEILPPRHLRALRKTLVLSHNSMYMRLVKRPVCGARQSLPSLQQKKMEYEDWVKHRERILKLAIPKSDFAKLYDEKLLKDEKPHKPLSELMPRILQLSALQQWKVDLMNEIDKDIIKVRSKALQYDITPRVEELARPKKVEDCSLEGTLRTQIIARFDKKLENELLRRRALAKMNFKRVWEFPAFEPMKAVEWNALKASLNKK